MIISSLLDMQLLSWLNTHNEIQSPSKFHTQILDSFLLQWPVQKMESRNCGLIAGMGEETSTFWMGSEVHPAYYMGTGAISPGVKCLTTHPHLAQRLRMCVATYPLFNMPSWYTHRKFAFIFYLPQFTAFTYTVLYIWGGGGGLLVGIEK
jgi:hypothetical protein